MELPKYHETFIPVLETLKNVDSLNSRELASRVRDNYYSDLPIDLLSKKTDVESLRYPIIHLKGHDI